MEIVLVSRAIYPIHGYGGMERHCHDWILAMSQEGCKIHVVTMPPTENTGLTEFPKETSWYFVPGSPARTVLRRMTLYPRWVKRVEILLNELFHAPGIDGIYAHGLAAASCTVKSIPLYYNPHGMEEFQCTGLKYAAYSGFRNMSRQAASRARRLIATDASLIPEIVRLLNVPETKVQLIPNAVFLDDRTPQKQRSDFGIGSNEIVLLAAGRLEPNKGLDVLLKALSMTTTLPPFRLIIAGDGSQRAALTELAGICRLESQVIFTGAVSEADLRSLYALADLFVHPTLYEGSSLVTLEAMRAGLAVVASNTGGIPDKVYPGVNGWLTPPGRPRALAQTLEQAFQNRGQWKSMGRESARIVREKYSWPSAVREFVKLISSHA